MKAKYDKIGIGYNLTRKADKYLVERLMHHLNPRSRERYLDIGCGTGNYTIELQRRGFECIGIDPSKEMLMKAMQKYKSIDWRQGQAEKTNLEDKIVSGIIAVLTIHHWSDLMQGFSEMYRVLKPKGKMVIFTSTPVQMKEYWLNHYFPEMLNASITQMPSFERIEEAMIKAGFTITGTEAYAVKPDLEDLFLYSGKHNPGLYLNPEVRNGISSFSSLANKNEVAIGLSKLQQDIDDGKTEDVIRSYENRMGDYLFIIGEK
ncbi:type 11 methyltransferase [Flammeovirgaceae bacterium 311]|nr:type 11 methyltransferase [Flammeovirgaceae bacterium 311]